MKPKQENDCRWHQNAIAITKTRSVSKVSKFSFNSTGDSNWATLAKCNLVTRTFGFDIREVCYSVELYRFNVENLYFKIRPLILLLKDFCAMEMILLFEWFFLTNLTNTKIIINPHTPPNTPPLKKTQHKQAQIINQHNIFLLPKITVWCWVVDLSSIKSI